VTADLDLLKGTLDTLVLKTLSWGPRHGYAVARWIKDATDGTITVDWRLRNHVFTDLAGCHCSAFLLGGQQATPIGGAKATSNFFDGLGVRPILGRAFLAGEDAVGAPHAAILSYGLWEREFGRDQNCCAIRNPFSCDEQRASIQPWCCVPTERRRTAVRLAEEREPGVTSSLSPPRNVRKPMRITT
jgi:hypothetical protein